MSFVHQPQNSLYPPSLGENFYSLIIEAGDVWFTIVFYIVPLFHGFSNFILLNRDCKYLRTLTGVIGPNSDFVQFTADLGLNNSNPLEVNLGLVTWKVLNLHIVINL